MRLLELLLCAYGPFTDVSLDLSAGSEGLHIIYGPNEAGKSSTLRAITDLLYGIPLRTTDDFRHEMKRLRIGGRLRRADGSELPIVRRKGRENTLLDSDGQPLDEAVLTRCLQGISREQFQSLFGISHGSLVEGGREIVAGKGELAQALFAAGTGIRQVRAVLASLENEASQLYVLRGKEQPVNLALKRLETARAMLANAIIPTRKWQEDVKALETAEQERTAVLDEVQHLREKRPGSHAIAPSCQNSPHAKNCINSSNSLAK